MLKWLSSIWDSLCNWTVTGIGTGIAATGIVIKELSIVLILLGILLWMFKYTKVFRVGVAGYLIGLVLEILGSLMI